MKELKGKCKEYQDQKLCFGCEQLAYPDFEGDDNCPYIKEREELENERDVRWRAGLQQNWERVV